MTKLSKFRLSAVSRQVT